MHPSPGLLGQRTGLVAVTVCLLVAMAGCTGGDGEVAEPAELVAAAAEALDAAETVTVTISSDDLPGSGSALVAADGVAQRPDEFSGTVQARVAGVTVDFEVLSSGGAFYARLPFTDELAETDPAELGFGDPAALLDVDAGLGRLLTEAESLTAGEEQRREGEVLDEVGGQIPGELVADLLTSADPSRPVEATFLISREDQQLRVVVLTGPFYETDVPTSYTVELTGYDEPVTIPAVPDGA